MTPRISDLATVLTLFIVGCGSPATSPLTPRTSEAPPPVTPKVPPAVIPKLPPAVVPNVPPPATPKVATSVPRPRELVSWAWAPTPTGPPRVLIRVKYDDGSVSGLIDDRDVRVGTRVFKLSHLRRWQRRGKNVVEAAEGPPIEGTVVGLDVATVKVGGRDVGVDLAGAVDLFFEASSDLTPVADLEQIREHRYFRPFHSPTPVFAVRAYAFDEAQPNKRTDIYLNTEPSDFHVGFDLPFFAGKGSEALWVQATHARPRSPFNQTSRFSDSEGRMPAIGEVCQGPGGEFVMWELERSGPRVDRLALDFNGRMGPAMIRHNSSFK
jgi:hypothetical protein